MADTVESIYQDFAAAMEAYSQAVTGIDNAMIELRAAEKKLQAVFDAYTRNSSANTIRGYGFTP